MKKPILILFLVAMPFLGVFAQPQEKLEALKIAFITRQLNLTTDEAQKFWPIYNQYEAESKKLQQEQKQNPEDVLKFQQKMLDLKKKYKPEFLKAISQEKFDKLVTIEQNWKDKLRQELDRRREQRQDRKAGER